MAEENRFEDYVFQVSIDEDGEFFLTIPRLPGCVAAGETLAEAVENLKEAFADWTADVVAAGHKVPSAVNEAEFSGKTLLRMPKWLHAALAVRAEEEGLSFNALAVSFLSRSLGADAVASDVEETMIGMQRQMSAMKTMLADVRSGMAARADVTLGYPLQAFGESGHRFVHEGPRMRVQAMHHVEDVCRQEAAPGYLVPGCFDQ